MNAAKSSLLKLRWLKFNLWVMLFGFVGVGIAVILEIFVLPGIDERFRWLFRFVLWVAALTVVAVGTCETLASLFRTFVLPAIQRLENWLDGKDPLPVCSCTKIPQEPRGKSLLAKLRWMELYLKRQECPRHRDKAVGKK